ncbi:hypothetical protein ODR35_27775, partial [Escherichia coli]|nr:hypothetical protein [Escherichia coli]
RQKQKKLIMLPSETMIWQPEFTDKTLSRKPGAVQNTKTVHHTFAMQEESHHDENNDLTRKRKTSGIVNA